MATVRDKSGNSPGVDVSYPSPAKRLKEIAENTEQTAENTTPA